MTTPSTEPLGPALTEEQALAALGPSIVYVSTDWAAGTALAIEDGYLITNASLVAPFDTVAVTRPNGAVERRVPVVGVDFDADLALIGPVPHIPLPPITLGHGAPVGSDDEVFLFGYPWVAEPPDDLHAATAFVNALPETPLFDVHFVQALGDEAGASSGGAMVDVHGRVIGLLGRSLHDDVARALHIDDVVARLDALRAGGQLWHPLGAATRTLDIEVPMHLSYGQVSIPWAESDAVVSLAIGDADPEEVGVYIRLDNGKIYSSQSMLAVSAAWTGTTVSEQIALIGEKAVLEPNRDGAYSFVIPVWQRASVLLVRTSPGPPFPISVASNRPMYALDDVDDGTRVQIGDTVSAIIEPYELQDRYTIDLRAGESVRIRAESATGDMVFSVFEPGATFDPDDVFVDGVGGRRGLDAEAVYTASVDGLHEIIVRDNTRQSGYRLTLEDPEEVVVDA